MLSVGVHEKVRLFPRRLEFPREADVDYTFLNEYVCVCDLCEFLCGQQGPFPG